MRPVAAALSLLFPAQAMALSCMPPTVEAAYGRAAKAAETYVVVSGTLVFDEGKLPKRGHGANKPPRSTKISARISGHSLTASGFSAPFAKAITLDAQCLGPWCGSVQSGYQQLAFLKKAGGGYVLRLDPCASSVFTEPSPAQLRAAKACMNGANCR